MAIQPMALAVANPEINAVQAMSEGVNARQQMESNNLTLAKQSLNNIGSMAFGVMGGKIDGQADPQMWEQSLDMLAGSGMNVDQFRGRPDLAPIVARASVDTLGQLNLAQNERELEQRLQQFAFTVSEAAKGPKPTANMQDFAFSQQNPGFAEFMGKGPDGKPPTIVETFDPETGQPIKGYMDGTTFVPVGGTKAPTGPLVQVNTGEGGDGALDKKLSEAEGTQWADYKTAGTVSASNAQDFEILGELLQLAPQGPITGRLAEIFPGFSAAGDAVNAIVKRIAPTMRAPGSGSTSDIEYDGMLRSLPALSGTPEGNRMVLSIMQAKSQINMERARLITAYQNGDENPDTGKPVSVGETRRKLNELDAKSIMTPEMKRSLVGLGSDGEVGTPPPSIGAVVDGYKFNGGDPSSPTSWTKVE